MGASFAIRSRPHCLWSGPGSEDGWRKRHDDCVVGCLQRAVLENSDPDGAALAVLPYRPDLLLRVGPAALRNPRMRRLLLAQPACALALLTGFYAETAPSLEHSLAGSGESVHRLLQWSRQRGVRLRSPEGFFRETLIRDSYWGRRHARATRNASLFEDLRNWAGDERFGHASAAAYYLLDHPGEPVGPYRSTLLSNPFYAFLSLEHLHKRGFEAPYSEVGRDPRWCFHFALHPRTREPGAFETGAAADPAWLLDLAAVKGWLDDPWKRTVIHRTLDEAAAGHPLRHAALSFLLEPHGTAEAFSSPGNRPIPPVLASGQSAEAAALEALRVRKNTEVWRPSADQVRSPAFQRIVGVPRYTLRGLPRGTIVDSVEDGLAEIKTGSSVLDSTYQLRLQTYRSVIEDRSFRIYTSRPVEEQFGRWLHPWGVRIEPLPRADA